MHVQRRLHASCVSRDENAVLVVGPSGCGKSDLVLRLLSRGFELVADDQVDIEDGIATCPPALAGMLEARGLGILRMPYRTTARLALVVALGGPVDRLPLPHKDLELNLPLLRMDAFAASAPDKLILALDCALGRISQVAGAFAA